MKKMKKLFAVLLTMVMVLSMTATAFAQNVDCGNGPATITIKNAQVGATYNLYKIFDANVSADGEHIAYSTDKEITENDFFEKDAQNNITVKPAAKNDKGELTEAAIEWIKGFATTSMKEVDAEDTEVTFDGLEYGYYYVTSTVNNGGAVTVDSTKPDAIIIDKNQDISWKDGKKIVIVTDEKEELVDTADMSIGDVVNFRITFNATNYKGVDQVKEYIVSDTLDNTFEFGKITKVYVDGDDDADTDVNLTETYKDTDDVDNKFTITIPWATENNGEWTSKYAAKSVVTIEYNATLKDNANIGTANKNLAKVQWTFTDGTSGELPDETTESYTTSLTINKKDGNDKALLGAAFKIEGTSLNKVVTTGNVFVQDENGTYWLLKDGTYTTTEPKENTANRYENTTTKYRKEAKYTIDSKNENVNVEAFVNDDAQVIFAGLGEGTYKITETVTPAGYNTIAPFEVIITFNPRTKTYTATMENTKLDNTNNKITMSVVNEAGALLPSTGGMGTTIFYVIGSILVLGAAILLVAKKRMSMDK